MPTNPTLADLAAAQQNHTIYGFSIGEENRQLARLRAIYAKKRTELEALDYLFEETTPDFVLRGANGSEVVLRLSFRETSEAYSILRQALETGLRKLEAEIVDFLVTMEQDAELINEKASSAIDLRPTILALCQPTSSDSDLPTNGLIMGVALTQGTHNHTSPTLGTAA